MKDTTMTKMKLSDLQIVLLSTASQRDSGSFLPLPESLDPAKATKALGALLKRKLAQEIVGAAAGQQWRAEDDLRIGIIITEQGRNAIGLYADEASSQVSPGTEGQGDNNGTSKPPVPPAPRAEVKSGTKQALLISLLQRQEGVSIAEICEATGWLPHTGRAALTGLKKKGFTISGFKSDGVRRYQTVWAG